MSKQVRFIPLEDCNLKLREGAEGQTSRTVVGRPIMFGVRSKNLTPWSRSRVVFEVLEPGCLPQELINRSDVVYNNNHSNKISDMIGRWRMGKGTLNITLHENYVEISCDYPNTTTANDTLEQIRLGNVYGMSFAFEDDYEDTENGVSYERTNETIDGKEVWLRHVKKIIGLYDVANVTHPAYEQTTVGTREESDRIDHAIEEQLKREQHQETEEEKQEREAKEREANGGETNAEKAEREAREQAEREANGGETNAEKEAREQREAEELERKAREAKAVMRMRLNLLDLETEEIDF